MINSYELCSLKVFDSFHTTAICQHVCINEPHITFYIRLQLSCLQNRLVLIITHVKTAISSCFIIHTHLSVYLEMDETKTQLVMLLRNHKVQCGLSLKTKKLYNDCYKVMTLEPSSKKCYGMNVTCMLLLLLINGVTN